MNRREFFKSFKLDIPSVTIEQNLSPMITLGGINQFPPTAKYKSLENNLEIESLEEGIRVWDEKQKKYLPVSLSLQGDLLANKDKIWQKTDLYSIILNEKISLDII